MRFIGEENRPRILAALVVCFFIQSALIYGDLPRRGIDMSPAARAGVRLWRRNNCQTCHQIYGYGGFLGPDLTNVVERLSADEIHQRLRSGSGKMPCFEFSAEERRSMIAFFQALDRTGKSQPTPPLDEEGWPTEREIVLKELPWFEYQ